MLPVGVQVGAVATSGVGAGVAKFAGVEGMDVASTKSGSLMVRDPMSATAPASRASSSSTVMNTH
jgi:hypothetical protein